MSGPQNGSADGGRSLYAEGRYDPWTDGPLAPEARPRVLHVVTVADARGRFLQSRSHLALNTRLNYERVTLWFVDHVGEGRPVHLITTADVQRWIDSPSTSSR